MRRGGASSLLLGFVVMVGCEGCGTATEGVAVTTESAAETPSEVTLLAETGELAEGDAVVRHAYSDFFELQVRGGEALRVELTSEAFDPLLEATAVGVGTLANDDWEGRRDLSRIELVPSSDGELKIRVTSFSPGATGAYALRVVRVATPSEARGLVVAAPSQMPMVTPGGSHRGEVREDASTREDGARFDAFLVEVPDGRVADLEVQMERGAARVVVMDPRGRYVDAPGGRAHLSEPGIHRVQVLATGQGAVAYEAVVREDAGAASGAPVTLARAHHQLPPLERAAPVAVGQEIEGSLAGGDLTLPSGETADVYVFEAAAGQRVAIEMGSRQLDAYLLLIGPNGRVWENDDDAGSTDARIEETLPHGGTYHLVATSYRAGEAGGYSLKVYASSRATGPVAGQGAGAPSGPVLERTGELAGGDAQLASGELYDEYSFDFQAGDLVRLELSSEDFDTYLILRSPNGEQQDNDDVAQGNTNSALELAVQQSGPYRVAVTSYRAGETGRYRLSVQGARGGTAEQARVEGGHPSDSAPAADERQGWRTFDDALRESDETIAGGRFSDVQRFFWPAGQAVHLEVRSADFDTVLVVRTPSGETHENDDQRPNDTNSALDFVTSEEGVYEVRVTSYRPREIGRYRLTVATPSRAATAETRPGRPVAPPVTAPVDGRTIDGRLTNRGEHRANGAFVAYHDVRLEAGQSVHLELRSADFDTYLMVQTPSGRTMENDDIGAEDLNSALDIPSAEAGVYRVGVTSYRPGDTGRYTLRVGRGPSIARPGRTGEGQGGHVFGVFVGISDYPGDGDLAECANDAIKLAEALRNAGLTAPDREVVLTDAHATLGNVRGAMQRMAQAMGPDDIFVFFYSGHGNRRVGSRDPGELDGADETLVLYDGELLDDEMARLFDALHGQVAILALDSCYSGGFAKDVIDAPGRMGLFSSEEDVVSMVASQFQAGGYLSHFLRQGVAGAADMAPHDDVLTAGELTHYVYQQFATYGRDIRLSSGYQHLVVDRGSIGPDRVLWGYR